MRALAAEYHRAAAVVLPAGRRGQPLSRSPYRLLAIQAIELYLNAYLLDHGHDARDLRRLQHDLCARTQHALATGLVLRARTLAHLKALGDGREYLVARYAPEQCDQASHLNRLAATLEEVSRRTAAGSNGSIAQQGTPARPLGSDSEAPASRA